MSSSRKAAINLGPNCLANPEVYKNTDFEEIQSLVNITQKLIWEHFEEILNVNTIESASPSWTRSVSSHDQVIRWTKAKVRVYSDSVLCLGMMNDSKDAITKWEGQVEVFKMSPSYKELTGIDGEPIVFEWNVLPGLSSLQILQKIQDDLRERNIEPEKFTDRMDHLHVNVPRHRLDKKRKRWNLFFEFTKKVKDYAKRFLQGHWTFLGLEDEKKWLELLSYTPEGKSDFTATQMVERFKDTRHPKFKNISALSRGILKMKNNTVHINTKKK